jgi:hypothetical protein
MNCKQVNKLLPLYAGHDLAKSREHLVTAHLQTCATCSLAAAAYRDARELMHDFAQPVFGDEVYAEIRKTVWQQIERKPKGRSIFESITVWFGPQFAWAAAAVLMITISIVGLYFINREFTVRPTGIVDIPRTIVPAIGPVPERQAGAPLIPGEGPPNRRLANMPKRQRRPDRMVAPDRGNSLVAYSPDAEGPTVQSSSPVVGTDNRDFAAPGADKTLRMEIQTKNPNIRIIWFSQREPKPLTTPSKGI